MAKRATLSDFTARKPAHAPRQPEPAGASAEGRKVDDRRGQTLRLSVEAWRQLKIMAAEETIPVHAILVEAVNDAFRKRGKPPIA